MRDVVRAVHCRRQSLRILLQLAMAAGRDRDVVLAVSGKNNRHSCQWSNSRPSGSNSRGFAAATGDEYRVFAPSGRYSVAIGEHALNVLPFHTRE